MSNLGALEGRDADDMAKRLRQIIQDNYWWTTLFIDDETGNLWRMSFPNGELQAGGPALLEPIPKEEALRQFMVEPRDLEPAWAVQEGVGHGCRLRGFDVSWVGEDLPLRIWTPLHEELKVSPEGALVLHSWSGEDQILLSHPNLFYSSRFSLCVIRHVSRPQTALVLGVDGSILVEVDFDQMTWNLRAEVQRVAEISSRRGQLKVAIVGGRALIFWELGVLALDAGLGICWRYDIEWNHEIIHLDEDHVWYGRAGDSAEFSKKNGMDSWGYSLKDGCELVGIHPPQSRRLPW